MLLLYCAWSMLFFFPESASLSVGAVRSCVWLVQRRGSCTWNSYFCHPQGYCKKKDFYCLSLKFYLIKFGEFPPLWPYFHCQQSQIHQFSELLFHVIFVLFFLAVLIWNTDSKCHVIILSFFFSFILQKTSDTQIDLSKNKKSVEYNYVVLAVYDLRFETNSLIYNFTILFSRFYV